MSDIDHLIESWKARRDFLSRQREMLERGDMRTVASGVDVTQQDIARLKAWISELDALLAEYKD